MRHVLILYNVVVMMTWQAKEKKLYWGNDRRAHSVSEHKRIGKVRRTFLRSHTSRCVVSGYATEERYLA